MDLLDPTSGQAMMSKRPVLKASRSKDFDSKGEEIFKVDPKSGKLIISEKNEKEKESMSSKDILEK